MITNDKGIVELKHLILREVCRLAWEDALTPLAEAGGEAFSYDGNGVFLSPRGDFFSLPYSRFEQSGKTKTHFMLGLAGWESDIGGEFSKSWTLPLYYQDKKKDVFVTPLGGKSGNANWIVPLYWQDKDTFASLPYCQMRGSDGEIDGAFSFPLLSGYDRDRATGDRLLYLFAGLC